MTAQLRLPTTVSNSSLALKKEHMAYGRYHAAEQAQNKEGN